MINDPITAERDAPGTSCGGAPRRAVRGSSDANRVRRPRPAVQAVYDEAVGRRSNGWDPYRLSDALADIRAGRALARVLPEYVLERVPEGVALALRCIVHFEAFRLAGLRVHDLFSINTDPDADNGVLIGACDGDPEHPFSVARGFPLPAAVYCDLLAHVVFVRGVSRMDSPVFVTDEGDVMDAQRLAATLERRFGADGGETPSEFAI